MSVRTVIFVTLICLAVTLGMLLLVNGGSAAQAKPPARREGQKVRLMAHAGAGIRPALDELGSLFEKQNGIKVEYNYKGSGCLLADVCASQKGDVYIPGEIYYMQQAVDRKLVPCYRIVSNLTTVLIVQAGNPKKVKGVQDLARRGMRVGIGDPEVVAVGRAAREVLTRAGVWKQVEKNIAMTGQNVTEVSNGVKLGHIDAAIVWDATAALYGSRELTVLPIPEDYRVVSAVPAGPMKFSRRPKEAEEFVCFLASDQAAEVFKKHGFITPVPAAQRRKMVKGTPA